MKNSLEQEITFWRSVIAADYAVPAGMTAQSLLPRLMTNLGSTDPTLRDEITYDVFTEWMYREGFFTPDDMRAIGEQMVHNLFIGLGETETDTVFLRTFSILILTKVVEFDHLRKFMSPAEIKGWLDRVLEYFLTERDVRGFVPVRGWAHSIAHTADALEAFALSPYIQTPELERILNAVTDRLAVQINAVNITLEDERLAHAVMVALKRNVLDLSFLEQWIERTAHPIGDQRWYAKENTFQVLSAYQNSRQFLRSLYFQLNFGIRAPYWYTDTSAYDRIPRFQEELMGFVLKGIKSMDQGFYPRQNAV